jgi:hypothetical protein
LSIIEIQFSSFFFFFYNNKQTWYKVRKYSWTSCPRKPFTDDIPGQAAHGSHSQKSKKKKRKKEKRV